MNPILFFATLRERAGLRATTLALPEGARISDVKVILRERYPNLAPALGSALVAINHEFASDDDVVPPHAEIAFFPPVSGG
jgi:molybdopterin synthase sulfur carrier subunit